MNLDVVIATFVLCSILIIVLLFKSCFTHKISSQDFSFTAFSLHQCKCLGKLLQALDLVPPPVTLGQLHCARAPQVGGCSAPIPRRHLTLSHFKLNTCSLASFKNEASSSPSCGPHHLSVLYSSPLHSTWSLNLLVAETRAGLRLLKGIPPGVH